MDFRKTINVHSQWKVRLRSYFTNKNSSDPFNLSNVLGLSLVELMISLGLMSVVSIAVTNLATSMAKQSFQQNAKNSFQDLVNNLNIMTNNQSLCENAFKGKYYNPSDLPQAVTDGVSVSGFKIIPGKKFGNLTINSLNWVSPDTFIGKSSVMVGSPPVAVTLDSHFLSMEISALVRLSKTVNQELKTTIQFVAGINSFNIIQNCLSTLDPQFVCTQLGGVYLDTGPYSKSKRCGLTFPTQDAFQGQSCTDDGLLIYSASGGLLVCSGTTYKPLNH